MDTKLRAPGSIQDIGWVKQPGEREEHLVEWSYLCEHGHKYALRDRAKLEGSFIRLLNFLYEEGHLIGQCGCNPNTRA